MRRGSSVVLARDVRPSDVRSSDVGGQQRCAVTTEIEIAGMLCAYQA
jgi:hypothetical protein